MVSFSWIAALLWSRAASASTCYTTLDEGDDQLELGLIDPDDGSVSVLVSDSAYSAGDVSGLGVIGDTAYACIEGRVVAFDLLAGGATEVAAGCVTVGPGTDTFLLGAGSGSPVASVVGPPDELTQAEMDAPSVAGARLAAGVDSVYSAPFSGGFVDEYPMGGGDASSIALAGFTGWVWGITEVDGDLVVLTDGREDGAVARLLTFDPLDGAALRVINLAVNPGTAVRGLSCS